MLILDEPTNDLDVETLTVLEDFLDSWPGVVVAVTHDRYFLERISDMVYAIMGVGRVRHLPRGVDQYLDELGTGIPRRTASNASTSRRRCPMIWRRPEIPRLMIRRWLTRQRPGRRRKN